MRLLPSQKEVEIAAVVEFDFEQQRLAPAIIALAVEMQRLSCTRRQR